MIYPRLELLRDLLAEDGSIWVTIDDNEGHYLKVLMNEVFGRKRFIARFVWERDKEGRGDADVAIQMEELDAVKFWVRSLERQPDSKPSARSRRRRAMAGAHPRS